ncbi:MAG: peptidase and chymotrypsin/Hap [candidate division NC10 bacterium]|nr:peptidase and chymotrypsin/Hap [candidate division NC10 bacterium]
MRSLTIGAIVLALGTGCALQTVFQPSRAEVIEQIVPSAVQIVLERDGERFRSGSGVAIAARPSAQGVECFVLTSGHTLSRRSETDRVFVLFGRHRSTGTKVAATIVAHGETENGGIDLAVLRARADECAPAHFGSPPRLGDPIWVVAYPWGRNMTLVGGIVSQINADPPGDRATAPRFIVDASVSYGSSGGGVYDADGRLVGVVEGYRTARVTFEGDAPRQSITVPVPGETYVVPLADIRRFLHAVDQADLPTALQTVGSVRP